MTIYSGQLKLSEPYLVLFTLSETVGFSIHDLLAANFL